ncbi:prolyl-tRNA synthetase associated domain-containing protein [Lachnospiraceae bacterium 62-35]
MKSGNGDCKTFLPAFSIDNTVYHGRPASCAGRSEREIRSYDILDSLNIPYLRLDHDPAAAIGACHGIEELLGVDMCKNLFLCNAQKTKFYLLMMPGQKKFRTALLSKQIQSSRLSFASQESMENFLDISPGSVSILGLMNDKENQVQLLIDKDILDGKYIGCHPCVNTSSLRILTSDIMDKFLPAVRHSFVTVEFPWGPSDIPNALH